MCSLELTDDEIRAGLIIRLILQPAVDTDRLLRRLASEFFQLILVQTQTREPRAKRTKPVPCRLRLLAARALGDRRLDQVRTDLVIPYRKHPFGHRHRRSRHDFVAHKNQHDDNDEPRGDGSRGIAPSLRAMVGQPLDEVNEQADNPHDSSPETQADRDDQQELRWRVGFRPHRPGDLVLPPDREQRHDDRRNRDSDKQRRVKSKPPPET